MTTTDSPQPNSDATQPPDKKPDAFGDAASRRNWEHYQAKGYKARLDNLADLGAREAMSRSDFLQGGVPDEARIKEMAAAVLEKTEARKITGGMERSRSSVLGGATKASGSALGGAAKGAVVGGMLALATRPLNWVLRKVTGDRLSVSGKSLVTLGAVFYAGKNIMASLDNSYIAPGGHNKTIAELSQVAVEDGIRNAYGRRAQNGPDAPSPEAGGPAPVSPAASTVKPPFADTMASIRAGMAQAGASSLNVSDVTEITPPERPLDNPQPGTGRNT